MQLTRGNSRLGYRSSLPRCRRTGARRCCSRRRPRTPWRRGGAESPAGVARRAARERQGTGTEWERGVRPNGSGRAKGATVNGR